MRRQWALSVLAVAAAAALLLALPAAAGLVRTAAETVTGWSSGGWSVVGGEQAVIEDWRACPAGCSPVDAPTGLGGPAAWQQWPAGSPERREQLVEQLRTEPPLWPGRLPVGSGDEGWLEPGAELPPACDEVVEAALRRGEASGSCVLVATWAPVVPVDVTAAEDEG